MDARKGPTGARRVFGDEFLGAMEERYKDKDTTVGSAEVCPLPAPFLLGSRLPK